MQLLTLKIDNFLSFGTGVVVNFSELAKHTQLLGVNLEEDPEGSASNGAGKTSIELALQEVLYSKNSKGIKKADLENRYIKSGYKLELEFIENDSNYKVSVVRTKSGKGTITLSEDGVDISSHTVRDTLKKIEEIIKLDFHTFVQLTYQSTDKTFDILRANEAARAKLLISLFNLETYTDRASAAKDLSNFAKSSLLEKTQLRKRLVLDSEIVIAPKKEYKDFNDEAAISNLEAELVNLKADLSSITTHNKHVDEEALRVRKHNLKQADIRKKLEILKSHDMPYTEFDESEYEQLKLDVHTTKQELISLNKDKLIYGEYSKNCRECGAELETGFNAEKLEYTEKQIKISIGILSELETKLENLRNIKLSNGNTETKKREIKWLESTLDNDLVVTLSSRSSSELKKRITTLTGSLKKLKDEKSVIENYNRDISSHNAVMRDRERSKLEAAKALSALDKEIDKLGIDKTTADTLAEALKLLVKFKLESLLLTLQDSVNSYMHKLFRSDVALIIGLKSSKLHFSVLKDSIETPVESLSNGEYSKTAVALLFAVREALEGISNTSVNLLFLDEVLAALDSLGVEALYEIIETLDCKVISVSHSMFDNKLPCITVEKDINGISTIKDLN